MSVSVAVTVFFAVHVSEAEFDRVCSSTCFRCCFHMSVSGSIWPSSSPCPGSMTVSVSVYVSVPGPSCPIVSNRVRVCFRVLSRVVGCVDQCQCP